MLLLLRLFNSVFFNLVFSFLLPTRTLILVFTLLLLFLFYRSHNDIHNLKCFHSDIKQQLVGVMSRVPRASFTKTHKFASHDGFFVADFFFAPEN